MRDLWRQYDFYAMDSDLEYLIRSAESSDDTYAFKFSY